SAGAARGYVQGVGLEAAEHLAGAAGGGGDSARHRVVSALPGLEAAGQDTVHPAAPGNALGPAGELGVPLGEETPEVHPGGERGDVALRERMGLEAVPPPGRIGERGDAERLEGLTMAEGNV